MKRFLSWLALFGCYVVFTTLASLDMALLRYIIGLYSQLSPFLKLVVIFFGGSAFIGLTLAPLYYGIPLSWAASEAVCPSKKGTRYIVFGTLTVVFSVTGAIMLGFIAVIPLIANIVSGGKMSSLAFGGSSIIIVVGVVLETAREIEGQMTMRHYKGFLQ